MVCCFIRGTSNTLVKSARIRQIMTALILIAVACCILPTKADSCSQGQHCSSCDEASGNCVTDCEIGYFDRKCKSDCSKNCKQKKCKEQSGLGVCTEGCELGYHGENCKLSCLESTQSCVKCSGGCDGLYCIQKGSCFSGCQDSYYGSDCKKCSRRCKSCNRITGTCVQCHPPYHGKNCQYSCNNCSGSCDGECSRTCAPGFYGTECAQMCSDNCRPNPAIHAEEQCTEHDRNITDMCLPECHSESGECLHGCVAGWYGPMCMLLCNSTCINKRCVNTGTCVESCKAGYSRKDCKPCSEICTNYTCNSNNETCLNECNNGMYGQFCNLTSKCIEGCFIAKNGCIPNCSTDISTDECTNGSCNKDRRMASDTYLYVISLIGVLVVAVSGCYVCYIKGQSSSRFASQDEESCPGDKDEAAEDNYHLEANVATTSRQRNSEHFYDDVDITEDGPVIVFL